MAGVVALKKVGKGELIKRIKEKTKLSTAKATEFHDAMIEVIGDAIADNEAVVLYGIGTLVLRKVKASKGISGLTKTPYDKPESIRLGLKVNQSMKVYLAEKYAQETASKKKKKAA